MKATAQNPLIINEQETKNNFLLNSLKDINKLLLASEAVTETDGQITYMESHLIEVAQDIATKLNFVARNGCIIISNDKSSYTINLTGSIPELIKNLESELKIDWSKKTHNNNTDKIESIHKTVSLRQTPELDLFCKENINSAKKGLENCEANYFLKDRNEQIKSLKKTIKYWTDKLNNNSYTEDYTEEDLKYRTEQEAKRKAIEDLNNEADTNENLKLCFGVYDNGHEDRLNALKLCKKYNLEPSHDIKVHKSLAIADHINDTEALFRTKWSNSLPLFEKYLQWLEIDAKNVSVFIKENYLKANGVQKIMSWRKVREYNHKKESLRKIEQEIDFIKSNEKLIKSFIVTDANN